MRTTEANTEHVPTTDEVADAFGTEPNYVRTFLIVSVLLLVTAFWLLGNPFSDPADISIDRSAIEAASFELTETQQHIVDDIVEQQNSDNAVTGTDHWFAADRDNVFVAGLTAERIETETGLELGAIVEEISDQLPGPTVTFESGNGAIQLDTQMFTFEHIVSVNPQATLETVAGYRVLVLGGLGAVIDFPEGPVTVSSYDFSLPDSGIQLAQLIAEARANT